MKIDKPNLKVSIDTAAIERTRAALYELGGAHVKIGVLSSTEHADVGGAAYLASIHEFGAPTRNIPSRSFLRLTMHQKIEAFHAWATQSATGAARMIMEGDLRRLLDLCGAKWVGYIHEAFRTRGFGQWLPLKPATIAHRIKHTSVPLQDTGALRRSITHEVQL